MLVGIKRLNWGSTSMKGTKTAIEHLASNLLFKKTSCFCCKSKEDHVVMVTVWPKHDYVSDFLWSNWQLDSCLQSVVKHEPWELLEFIVLSWLSRTNNFSIFHGTLLETIFTIEKICGMFNFTLLKETWITKSEY